MAELELSRDSKKANGVPEQDAQATNLQVAAQEESALGALRSIVFGDLSKQQEQTIARLESRIVAQTAALCGEFDALVRRLENRISEQDVRSARDRGDLREQLATQKNLLSQEIEERNTQVAQLVNEGLAELRDSKLDRDQFSDFLAGLATHLEGQAPSVEGQAPSVEGQAPSGSQSAEDEPAGEPSAASSKPSILSAPSKLGARRIPPWERPNP